MPLDAIYLPQQRCLVPMCLSYVITEKAGLHGTFIAERLFVQQYSAIVSSPMSCAASSKDFCCVALCIAIKGMQ